MTDQIDNLSIPENVRQSLLKIREHAKEGHLSQALAACQQTIASHPDLAEAHHEMGCIYKAMGRRGETFSCFHKALDLKPDFLVGLMDLGIALRETGQQKQALERFQAVLSICPDHAQAHSNMGMALADMGQFDQAKEHYRQATVLEPGLGEAWRCLSVIQKLEADDPRLAIIEKAFHAPDTRDEDRMNLGFSLAKFYEDMCRYDEAFACLSTANSLKRKSINYNISITSTLIKNIQEAFTPALFEQHAGSGLKDHTPIFILGMPRSGTTLVEQIVASHPTVHGAGELPYMEALISRAINERGLKFPKGLRDAKTEIFDVLADDYLTKLRLHSAEAIHITDKMLGNFMLIGLIHLMLPNARIVHVTRDPMDNCFSIYSRLFAKTHLYSYDMAELVSVYKLYRSLMQHWRTVLPGCMFELSYEALINEPEQETRKLLDYCGLTFHAACLSPHKTERSILTASNFQVRQPINKASVARWRHFESHLDFLRDELATTESEV